MSESDSAGHIAHHNLTLMTTADSTTLEVLLRSTEVRPFIWKRLDDRHALVDPDRIQLLMKRLRELGLSARFGGLDAT